MHKPRDSEHGPHSFGEGTEGSFTGAEYSISILSEIDSESFEDFSEDEDDAPSTFQWCDMFRKALEGHDKTARVVKWNCVIQDLLNVSLSFGKIILSEVYLSNRTKTIAPSPVTSHSASPLLYKQYINQGISFRLYFNNHKSRNSKLTHSLMKSASNEFLGWATLFKLSKQLGFSLPVLLQYDYQGFRLLAVTQGDTPADQLHKGLNLAFEKLNLKYTLEKTDSFIFEDLLPLEKPKSLNGTRSSKDKISWKRLRPEIIKNFHRPIGIGSREEVSEVIKLIERKIVPEMAEWLNDNFNADWDEDDLVRWIHSKGVNVRQLGILRKFCKNEKARRLIFNEIIARVIKNKLRHKLRKRMKEVPPMLWTPVQSTLVEFLNQVTGISSEESVKFWTDTVRFRINNNFPGSFSQEEVKRLVLDKENLKKFVTEELDMSCLFKRVIKLMGIVINEKVLNGFVNNSTSIKLGHTDVIGMKVRVKYLDGKGKIVKEFV